MNETKVLIVDDEKPILEEYGGLFGSQPFEVLTASDPQKAIGLLADQSITVLVTDQRMPAMTGLELVQKAREISPDTIRLILTAHADQDAMLEAINVGQVFRFLLKPCDPQVFIDSVVDAIDYAKQMGRMDKLINARNHYVDASSDLEILQVQLEERDAEAQMLVLEGERVASKQRETFKATLAALVSMIQIKNQALVKNGQWVATFSVKLGQALNMTDRDLHPLQLAGYLKNLGLLLLPDLYSEKSAGMFSNDELRRYYRFPILGEQVLKKMPGFGKVGTIISYQLERFDGTGPRAIAGDDIPLPSQILNLAHDAYQILFLRSKESGSESIYGRTYVVNHIRKNMNKLYGPQVAQASMKLLG